MSVCYNLTEGCVVKGFHNHCRVCYGPPHHVCNHTLAEVRARAIEAPGRRRMNPHFYQPQSTALGVICAECGQPRFDQNHLGAPWPSSPEGGAR